MEEKYALLLKNIQQLVTCSNKNGKPKSGGELLDVHEIADGAVLVEGEKIKMVGTTKAVDDYIKSKGRAIKIERELSLRGKTVMPGFVDPHTHMLFSGSRETEFAMRVAGKSYLEILNAGGGILNTLKNIRMSTEDELYRETHRRVELALMHGTTSMEIKSGYGLDHENEIKSLNVINKLSKQPNFTIVPTYMGAHAIPPEYKNDREGYISAIINKIIPYVAEKKLAKFNDVFVEAGVFTVEEGRNILEAGKKCGLIPKVHADEITECGGARLAAEMGAISADHLLMASDEGLAAMRDKGVVAVCLPGTLYSLLSSSYLSFDRLMKIGVPMALATDANPGSNMCLSMQTAINQAVLLMRTPPAAAINMATINSAHAIGVARERGSIEVGKYADMVVLEGMSYNYLPYCYGTNLVEFVIKNGSAYKVSKSLTLV
ncbi:MAG TPA: imidazolonepropionase [Candidatus Wallbacteria bacterium]|nr:imidazolonepropionase [Candidatus Wallbacteria bacterium]